MIIARRGFLGALAALVATGAVDPESMLWRPGERTFFLAPAGGWRGNTLLTVEIVAREALRILEKELRFARVVARSYDGGPGSGLVLGGVGETAHGRSSLVMTDHRCVLVSPASREDLGNVLPPAVGLLADQVRNLGLVGLGELPLPPEADAARASSQDLSVRVMEWPGGMYSVDVIGGRG